MKHNQPIKVLQVVGALGMGGAETWLMELLKLWATHGTVQMDFLLTSGERGVFDDEAQRLGARLHYFRYGRAHLGQFIRAYRALLKREQYDAIHDHADYVSGWHFLLGVGVLPPVRVAHVHNPWLHIEANYGVSLTRRLATKMGKQLVQWLATDVCGTSAEILTQYGFHVGQTRRPAVSVVHCGFEVERFNAPRETDRESVLREFAWPADTKIVLFAGRLDRALEFDHPQNHKNSWFALNVARAAVEKDPSVRLLMAGAGDEARQQLNQSIQEWGLQEHLRLIGVRNDISRLMRAADVLFFPSRQEGLGMVAVEAQAAGLPVLASTAVPRECVVVPELYESLPLRESINLWSGALLQAMLKPRVPREQCSRALEASAFSILNSARRLEEIYRGENA